MPTAQDINRQRLDISLAGGPRTGNRRKSA